MNSDTKPNTSELEIINAMRSVTLQGETIEVKEFSFRQEMEVSQYTAGIVNDLRDVLIGQENPDMLDIEIVFCKHPESYLKLLSMSTGKPVDWIGNLKGREGYGLFMAFWAVNAHFFTQRMLMSLRKSHPDKEKRRNLQ